MDNSVWRPCTQMKTALPPLMIHSAKGAILYAADGREYIDANSSWWVTLHGHAQAQIAGRIAEQAHLLEQVIFADCTHQPGIELAQKLAKILPGNIGKVFYSDNGSTAVEVGLKIALQYHYNRLGEQAPKKVVCLKGSYHGDTFGAMASSGKKLFNRPFWSHLFEVIQIDLKNGKQELIAAMKEGNLACFIYEPLVLGGGGMVIYQGELLNPLLKLCHSAGIPTIADEVLTGFGRMGPLFASELLEEKPDLICLSKGLTGGFLPLGATACSAKIYAPFHAEEREKAFLHSHSFCGNPIACASALASLELLLHPDCTLQREKIHAQHQTFVESFKNHPKLARCECLGTLLVLEYRCENQGYFNPLRDRLFRFGLERGVLFRPLGNVLYVLPPYCISKRQLQTIYETLMETLAWND